MHRLRCYTEKQKSDILERYNYTCVYCGDYGNTLDHIMPYSWKIDNSETNLVPCCMNCNLIAGNKMFNSFKDKQDFILKCRKSPKWKKKLKIRNLNICSSCKESFEPRRDGAGLFMCKQCSENGSQ